MAGPSQLWRIKDGQWKTVEEKRENLSAVRCEEERKEREGEGRKMRGAGRQWIVHWVDEIDA